MIDGKCAGNPWRRARRRERVEDVDATVGKRD